MGKCDGYTRLLACMLHESTLIIIINLNSIKTRWSLIIIDKNEQLRD